MSKSNLGDQTGAMADYNKALKIDPENALIYYNLGVVKDDLEDYSGAVIYYTKAIEIDPEYASSYLNRGVIKDYELNDHYGAIIDYTKVIKLEPNEVLAYYNRGLAKGNINDMEGACSDWRKASYIGDEDAAEFVKEDC